MELTLGKLVVLCLTAIAIVAMATGNDDTLLQNIIVFLGGMGTGLTAEVVESKLKQR